MSWFSFYFKSQIWTGRTEIRVHIFIFFSKRKSGRPDFWKGVHIFVFDENQNVNTFPVQICTEKVFTFRFSSKTQMWTPFQKSGRPDLWFEEIENVNTFPKIWTARFAFLMKMKIRTPFKNLNGQKLLRISTSGQRYILLGVQQRLVSKLQIRWGCPILWF